MVGLPSIIARYEHNKESAQVKRIIVDREGMATEFLANLHAEGRTVVTILQTNQYRDLTSFCDVGAFVPLSTDSKRKIIREVPPARIALPRSDHPGEQLCLQVALIRDLRRSVPVQPDPEDVDLPQRWDADRKRNDPRWWEEGWQATAAPAKETTAKLIPIVTTAQAIEPIELAQTYIHRWPAQENVIKDYLLPLGLDTNHGFAKAAVENSEVAKRRTHLQQRQSRLQQWAQSAGKREAQASKRRERLRKDYKSRSNELYRELGLYQSALERQEVADYMLRREIKERKAVIDAELEQIRVKEWRAYEQCNQEFRKQERYCKEQREVLRALEDLKAKERTMYELDHRKEQVMTVCTVALANLAMWVRDQYFPPSYAHATWRRLLPFFQLPGTVVSDATTIQVQLSPLTTARSIAIWHCCVNGSIRLHLGFPMDACSLSPSVLPVAFFLRRSITKYRDFLMMRVVVAILWRVPSKDHRRPARAADLQLPTETWALPEQDYRFCTRMSPLSVISMILA